MYKAKDLGVAGIEDTRVIDGAVGQKCLIVAVNKDFVQYYRDHPRRQSGEFFYGLIFLSHSKKFLELRNSSWQ